MKVGIVGVGVVGSTTAYTFVLRGVAQEIVLVDVDKERAEAEASDISHAIPFLNQICITAGGYEDLADSSIVVITAGRARKADESRLDLITANSAIMRSIVTNVLEHAPEAIILIATNPVDVMTHIASDVAAEYNIPPGRVFGSGTSLDTARFRTILGDYLGIAPPLVHAQVLGEHGDSMVIPWSLVTVNGVSLAEFSSQVGIPLTDEVKKEIEREVRFSGRAIIQGKGKTHYGISLALGNIVEAILRCRRTVMTLSTPLPEIFGVKNVSISMPRLVDAQGIIDTIELPLSLSAAEEEALRLSAQTVKDVYESVK
jgi:L-lactate dehydrogenase